ncbi:hypothetical protein C8R46DRAFT_1029329 [Mycena filopes]|nr:hypothetical protein C8R46DRAFT_1029329 [Mycena filopes]
MFPAALPQALSGPPWITLSSSGLFGGLRPTEPDAGPWDSKHWAKALCSPALFHLKFLVISTPVHPVWPPTEPQLVKRLHEWFGPLPLASHLTMVVLLCGYGDDAIRAEDYVEANGQLDAEVDGGEARDTKPLMGYDEGDCGWPPGVELSFHAPVVVCERDQGTGGWSEGDPAREYCGLGEWRFFFELDDRRRPRVCGYSEDIYQEEEECRC